MIFLERLCYIFECLSEDMPGEAKYELDRLIEGDIGRKKQNLDDLKKASELFHQQKNIHAASILSGISRSYWRSIIDG